MGLPRRRAVLVLAAAAAGGCYAPSAAPGVPCSASLRCPTGQVCNLSAPDGPTCIPPPLGPIEGLVPVVDVSAGGRFPFDATGARDEVAAPCATAGGPEVMFQLSLPAPEVVYLDAIGSSGEVAIAVHQGSCTSIGEAEGCAARTCGTEAQGAWRLPAGDHCIVVDHAGAPAGPGQLTVVRGGHDGDPLPGRSGTVTGDTCADDNSNDASCGCEPARDHHYFFTVCPETVSFHFETCTTAEWDTVLQLRAADDDRIGCNDDGCSGLESTLTRQITGPGLFWAIIDGCDECGSYAMRFSY